MAQGKLSRFLLCKVVGNAIKSCGKSINVKLNNESLGNVIVLLFANYFLMSLGEVY